MNVIRFELEVIRRRSPVGDKSTSMLAQIRTRFEESLDSSKPVSEAVSEQWSMLELRNVRAIRDSSQVVGSVIVEGIQAFIFESHNSSVRNKNNVSLEVIAIGDPGIETLLNTVTRQIRDILGWRIRCDHIVGSRIIIYPFDSTHNDIVSHDLKVKAKVKGPFNIGKTELIKWAVLAILLAIALTLYLTVSPENTLYRTVSISIALVLVFDFIYFVLVPMLAHRKDRSVHVSDLSTVVETTLLQPKRKEALEVVPR